jgi:hypothetical protein
MSFFWFGFWELRAASGTMEPRHACDLLLEDVRDAVDEFLTGLVFVY